MRIIILFFFILIGANYSYSQDVDVLCMEASNGTIKSIILSHWDEDTTGAPNEIRRTDFDIKGKATYAEYERTGRFKNLLSISYNDRNLVSEEKYVGKDNIKFMRYFYDNEYRLIRKEIQDEGDSEPNFVIEYTYAQGLKIEQKFYANRVFSDYKEYYYNAKGKDSLIVEKNGKGKILKRVYYSYANEDRYKLVEWKAKNSKKVMNYCECFNPADSIYIDSCYSNKNELKNAVKIVSNTMDLIVLYDFLDNTEPLHDISTFKYEYDQFGNWITKTVFLHGDFWYIEKRKITYYE